MFVEWIRGLDCIVGLKERWLNLERQVHDRTVYSRFDYILPWYRCYARPEFLRNGEPLVGLAWDGNDLVAIAPLITSRASFKKIPMRRVNCAGFNLAAGELLIRDGVAGVLQAFVDSVRDELRYELIALNGVNLASDAYGCLRSHLELEGVHFGYLDYDWYAVADLKDGYDAYSRARGSNFRKQTRKIGRKVEEAGDVRVDRVTTSREEPVVAFAMCDRMLAIAEKSWRVKRTTLEKERQHHQFYRDLFSGFGQQDAVDLSILVINGRDIAFSFALRERYIYYHTLIGFDDDFQDLSPGTHLLQETFKRLPDEGIHTVLSHGSYDYKRRWASSIIPQYTVCVFGPSLRAYLGYLLASKWGHNTDNWV